MKFTVTDWACFFKLFLKNYTMGETFAGETFVSWILWDLLSRMPHKISRDLFSQMVILKSYCGINFRELP